MPARVRFAPSPTGRLHVGNARTALFNWLFVRQRGGVLILRIEDTDAERSETGFEAQLVDDLRWLALDWDEGPDLGGRHGPYRQSERLSLYRKYGEQLIDAGSAYHCFCSPQQLEVDRKTALAAGRQPMYAGRCRDIPPSEAQARRSRGEAASIRLRILPHPIRFHDLVHGELEFPHEVIGDPILLRSDATAAYNYAVVIDDGLMEITHVIRGDDHLSNTPRQVAVYQALGWETPEFAHLSTILGDDHTRLSKRHGATSIGHFRQLGVLPEALVNYLALLGWSPGESNQEIFPTAELVQAFRLSQVTKSPAVFAPDKLYWLNRHYLKQTEPERVLRLAVGVFQQAGLVGETLDPPTHAWLQSLLETVLPSVDHLSELPSRTELIFAYDAAAALRLPPNQEVLAESGAAEVLTSFLRHALPDDELTPELTMERFRQIMADVKRETKQKGKRLFHPVRVAITGHPSGPELDKLIPLLEAGSRLSLPRRVKSARQRLGEFAREFRSQQQP